jgi:hypothetical protein
MIDRTCECGKALQFPDEMAGEQSACPWCGRIAALPGVAPAPSEETSESPPPGKLVELVVLSNTQANALVATLEASGVRAILWDQATELFGPMTSAKVMVPRESLGRAREILAGWRASEVSVSKSAATLKFRYLARAYLVWWWTVFFAGALIALLLLVWSWLR